jgi:GH24 family phage-related lysozyme (muramidase)
MAKAVHAGQLGVACDAFSGWYVIARGKKLPGLVKRREAERKLCMVDA